MINTNPNGSGFNNPLIPFSPEWNTQVLNLNIGLQYLNLKRLSILEYYPNFRYGYLYNSSNIKSMTKKNGVYGFIVDHQFKYHKFIKSKKNKYFTLGFSLNNSGKILKLNNLEPFKISYNSIVLGIGFELTKKNYLETSINIIPKTFPTNNKDILLNLNIGIKHNFSLL